MIPRIEMLKIALAHCERGAGFVYDDRNVPALQFEGRKCMIGLFIPVSSYAAQADIESMCTYELRDAGLFDEDEYRFISEMDKVNILDDEEWLPKIREKIDDELETID